MDSPIFKQISKFLQDRKSHKHWTVVFTCLAVLVCLGTVGALKLMGQAMTRKEKVLVCNMEVHAHTVECQDEAGNLICGFADYVVHVHNDDCYNSEGNLACTLPEIAAHTHSEACYAEEKVLVCGTEEVEGHVHEEACYEQQVTGLQCQTFEHQHGTGCYDEAGNLVCTAPEHQHANECYDAQGNLICGQATHTHMVSCYDAENNLVCTAAEHQHAAECLSSENILVCGLEEGADGHAHTDECYETQKVLACGQLELHTHSAEAGCFEEVPPAEEGGEPAYNLICKTPVLEEHVHSEEAGCFEIMEAVVADAVVPEGTEAVQSTELPEQGETVDGTEAEEFIKACEGEGYIVTATYGVEAEIPEEAEFVAELITPESNPQHYAERETQYREQTGDAKATMSALLKMGFYINGDEIEPKAAVQISVQMVDENGLPEGIPMTVVHFAEEGNEVLDGSHVKEGKTSFEMNSFSEVAIGYKRNAKPGVYISDSFEYESDSFNITFHVEGEATFTSNGENEGAGNSENSAGSEDVEAEADESSEEDTTSPETEGSGEESADAAAEKDLPQPSSNEKGNAYGQEPTEEETMDSADGGSDGNTSTENGSGSVEGKDNSTGGENRQEESSEETSGGSEESLETKGGIKESQTENDDSAQNLDFEFHVVALDENSTEYKAVIERVEEDLDKEEEIFLISPMTYSVKYKGNELDLSECKITAEIVPGAELNEQLNDIILNKDAQVDIMMQAVEVLDEGGINELGSVVATAGVKKISADLSSNTIVPFTAGASQDNPEFTVQYYAYVDVIDTDGTKQRGSDEVAIPLIDTTKDVEGKIVGHLPRNDGANISADGNLPGTLPILNIYAKKTNDKSPIVKEGNKNTYDKSKEGVYQPIYISKLMEIFESCKYNFANYPQLNNFNKFDVSKIGDEEIKSNYDLEEVWILKKGKSASSIEEADWTRYTEIENLAFTNNPENIDDNTIVITSDSVVRLVARSNVGGYNNDVLFHDIDVTDGEVYTKYTSATDSSPQSVSEPLAKGERETYTGVMYGNVNRQGINSNCTTGLGFGNADVGNSGTGLHEEKLNNTYNINQGNALGYGNCTFGIVSNRLGSDGYPVFNVTAPDIFGTSTVNGKTKVAGYSLDFNRNGDTYSLVAVNDGKIEEEKLSLDKFFYGGKRWGKQISMWQNSFWPMDSSETFGADGHDLKFGDKNKLSNRKTVGSKNIYDFMASDDGKDHNSYFTMNFSLEFKLTSDYVGPLNYYFFGDDDMWVFLDDELICDIGGVHQAAGEYVDLWNWIDKGDNSVHTLRFFYTERGASGSTCWMQFTLPAVASVPVDYDDGSCKNTLKVGKTVSGADTDESFEFDIAFYDKTGTIENKNYYAYEIQNKDGSRFTSGTIKTGDTFSLKDEQCIIVRNLPDGTKYVIREKNYSNYQSQINGTIEVDREAEGNIDWTKDDIVNYINVYSYELPETGGTGKKPYTMAGVIVMFGAGLLYRRKFRERRV